MGELLSNCFRYTMEYPTSDSHRNVANVVQQMTKSRVALAYLLHLQVLMRGNPEQVILVYNYPFDRRLFDIGHVRFLIDYVCHFGGSYHRQLGAMCAAFSPLPHALQYAGCTG